MREISDTIRIPENAVASPISQSNFFVRHVLSRINFMVKPHGLLVLVSFTRYRASTSSLSNRSSTCALQPLREGDLVLGRASHLYAFSGYHFRT